VAFDPPPPPFKADTATLISPSSPMARSGSPSPGGEDARDRSGGGIVLRKAETPVEVQRVVPRSRPHFETAGQRVRGHGRDRRTQATCPLGQGRLWGSGLMGTWVCANASYSADAACSLEHVIIVPHVDCATERSSKATWVYPWLAERERSTSGAAAIYRGVPIDSINNVHSFWLSLVLSLGKGLPLNKTKWRINNSLRQLATLVSVGRRRRTIRSM
jgi:hypothetical protein